MESASVLQGLKATPKGKLSYSRKWDSSSDAERLELLTKWTSSPSFSPENIAYLAERTRRLSLQHTTATSDDDENDSASHKTPSPTARHQSGRHHRSLPNTPLHYKSMTASSSLNTPRTRLRLVTEGDSPPASPVATPPATGMRLPETGQVTPEYSDPTTEEVTLWSDAVPKETTPLVHSTPVVMEMSVLAEQEAQLAEEEQLMEQRLWQEMTDRISETKAYLSDEQERIRQEAHESRVRSQAQRRRKEEVERAKMEALDMRWKQESDREMERLSESYRQHGEEMEAKLREGVEQKREIARRMEERKKQAVQRLRQQCVDMKQECVSLFEKFGALVTGCSHPNLVPEVATKAYQLGCRTLGSVQSALEQQLHTAQPDKNMVANLHTHLTSVYPLLAEVNSGMEEAAQRAQQKARDRQKQQQQQQQLSQQQQQQQQQQSSQQQQQQKPPAQSPQTSTQDNQKSSNLSSPALGMPMSVQKLYIELQDKLLQVTRACEALSQNTGVKKYRFDLHKAISVPVNAISGQSGEHLTDKIRRLQAILSGQRVQVMGKYVSASDHPQGRLYCFNLLAQKIVKQGEEQVSSRSEAAFPVAGVAVSLWVSFPELGELILAHFHSICPVLVPFYMPKKDGLSDSEHLRLLGFKVGSDGQVESEDNYLKRMSGVVRLYAAILQTPSEPHPHPHGLEHGWRWFARVLNMHPHPTLTATALYDMLEIAGHALLKAYGRQFRKVLHYICKLYIPCIEKITPAAQQGPLTRLKLFLEECVGKGSIPQPKGMLSDNFWRTHSHGIATA